MGHKDFEENGPTQSGISPQLAVDRLKKFKDELSQRERKMDMLKAGEELFALRPTRFTEVTRTRKEINLIDQLFSLWVDTNNSVKGWCVYMWGDVSDTVETMTETINGYDGRCKKLPKKLREGTTQKAFEEVRDQIADYLLLFPMLSEMSKPSIKARHWEEINELLSKPLPFESPDFAMSHVLESDLVANKEEVEEICDGADKQLQIEHKMSDLHEV
jgi:dynein heavy chain